MCIATTRRSGVGASLARSLPCIPPWLLVCAVSVRDARTRVVAVGAVVDDAVLWMGWAETVTQRGSSDG